MIFNRIMNGMKKLLLFSVIVFFASCSSTLENRARKQMNVTLSNEFKYANDFEISQEEIIFCDDSVYIMTFYMKGKKDNGETFEGKMEYAYKESSMWAFGHPEVRAWDDYLRSLAPSSKNSLEESRELMNALNVEGLSVAGVTPYGTMWSALFAVTRKVPSDFTNKVEEYRKE